MTGDSDSDSNGEIPVDKRTSQSKKVKTTSGMPTAASSTSASSSRSLTVTTVSSHQSSVLQEHPTRQQQQQQQQQQPPPPPPQNDDDHGTGRGAEESPENRQAQQSGATVSTPINHSSHPISYRSTPASSTPSHYPSHHESSVYTTGLFMPHQKSRRFARIFLFLLFITTILFFFLSFDCWPVLSSLFDIRKSPSSDTYCGRSCNFRSRNLKPFPVGTVHNSGHHSNSLLARPLKHLSNSFSLSRLSTEKVEALLNKENTTLSRTNSTPTECENRNFWRAHQRESAENRVSRLRSLCNLYDFDGKIFTYRTKSSNRQKTNNTTTIGMCSTHTCPLLINTNERLLACFVQKTASTSLKTLFLKLEKNADGANLSVETSPNLTIFHHRANDELHRISPVSLLGSTLTNSYTKALFVRHPFVRLVSAFKDKAETGPEREPFFWTQYWNPLLDKIHGKNRRPDMRLEFHEFVDNYLLQTDPYIWDEHWAPIWTRCEPCFVRYNLIGKLETSERDFRLLNSIILQQNSGSSHDSLRPETEVWKNRNTKFGQTSGSVSACNRLASKYRETRQYLGQLSSGSIIELYKKFYLDFELFGYTLEELFS